MKKLGVKTKQPSEGSHGKGLPNPIPNETIASRPHEAAFAQPHAVSKRSLPRDVLRGCDLDGSLGLCVKQGPK